MCFFPLTDTTFQEFDYIALLIFWLDIVFNIRTTYYNDNNEEVVDGKKCCLKYVGSSHFYIDVISAVPFRIFFPSNVQNLQLIKAFKVVKILRMLRMKRFQSYFADDQFRIVYKLFCLLLGSVIIVNLSTFPKYHFPTAPLADLLLVPFGELRIWKSLKRCKNHLPKHLATHQSQNHWRRSRAPRIGRTRDIVHLRFLHWNGNSRTVSLDILFGFAALFWRGHGTNHNSTGHNVNFDRANWLSSDWSLLWQYSCFNVRSELKNVDLPPKLWGAEFSVEEEKCQQLVEKAGYRLLHLHSKKSEKFQTRDWIFGHFWDIAK